MSVSELPALLLPPDQVADTMGTAVLKVDSNTSGHEMIAPPAPIELDDNECLSLEAPAQKAVYANTGWIGVQTLGVRNPEGTIATHMVIEAVIAFPGAAAAGKILADQTAHWSACSGRTLTVSQPTGNPPTPPQRWTVGPLTHGDSTLALTSVLENGHGLSCQRALANRSNIIVDVGACREDIANQALDMLDAIVGKIRP